MIHNAIEWCTERFAMMIFQCHGHSIMSFELVAKNFDLKTTVDYLHAHGKPSD